MASANHFGQRARVAEARPERRGHCSAEQCVADSWQILLGGSPGYLYDFEVVSQSIEPVEDGPRPASRARGLRGAPCREARARPRAPRRLRAAPRRSVPPHGLAPGLGAVGIE